VGQQRSHIELFRFMPERRFSRASFRVTAALFLCAGILVGGGLLGASVGKVIADAPDTQTILALPLAVLMIGWVAISASATFVTSADIELSEAGITLRPVRWWPVFVPWGAMQNATLRTIQTPLPYRRLGEDEWLLIVRVPGLTPVHRLAALYYGLGIFPMFVVTPDHEQHETLIARLRAWQPLPEEMMA
jgi:hypothetical protein